MEIKFNKRISSLLDSSTLAITARAKELKSQGADVVSFAAGEPDFDTPIPIKNAAIEAINSGFTKYTPTTGALDLREAICRKLKKDNDLEYTPNQIAVNCGAKHSVYATVQVLADEGEEVLIPAPYWVSYPEMVKLAGATSKFIETTSATNFKITAKQLEENITDKTKLLILNSPSNPTGMLYSKEELEAIAEVIVRKKIFVLSDEIYEKLIYESDKYVSIASLGKEIYERTITINGVSKSYSMTGWRIGYCAGHKDIISNIKRLQDHTTSNPTSISQKATIQALKEPEENLMVIRDIFKKRRDLMISLLDGIPEISYIKPQGAFYVFCDFSKLGASFDIAKRILDEVNVAIIPGEGFGAPGFVRLSFATSEERIKEGIQRISNWIKDNHN